MKTYNLRNFVYMAWKYFFLNQFCLKNVVWSLNKIWLLLQNRLLGVENYPLRCSHFKLRIFFCFFYFRWCPDICKIVRPKNSINFLLWSYVCANLGQSLWVLNNTSITCSTFSSFMYIVLVLCVGACRQS